LRTTPDRAHVTASVIINARTSARIATDGTPQFFSGALRAMTAKPNDRRAQPLDVVRDMIRRRVPRADASTEITISSVPLRTCYETMMRLHGPRESVLDYAATLFADESASLYAPAPPLTLEEAHAEDGGATLSLLLSRGSFSQV
jgi:hypothetical protein